MRSYPIVLSRRAALAGTGALVLSFSLAPPVLAQQSAQQRNGPNPPAPAPQLPGSLQVAPLLDSWIRIDPEGSITVFTGRAELGQGIKTALLQVAAEQLDADLAQLKLITADTSQTPNEGYTSGSHSMQDSGTAIMNAAAQVRQLLIEQAAQRIGSPADQMKTENAAVLAPDGRRFSYGDLVSDQLLHAQAAPQSPLKDPGSYRVMNRAIQRVDIPAKVTGGAAYVQDLRLPRMAHGRIVRPPSYGAQLTALDSGSVEKMPGVVKVVRDG
ncbi:MAG TPA: molybdopterin cofactor-binding domain-containing protein, partial [Xanthobacteraceae bacterium]|nr:molybdopterin cofactor-binding domain-containing protein [Xanthobacteraceae bacterium]